MFYLKKNSTLKKYIFNNFIKKFQGGSLNYYLFLKVIYIKLKKK